MKLVLLYGNPHLTLEPDNILHYSIADEGELTKVVYGTEMFFKSCRINTQNGPDNKIFMEILLVVVERQSLRQEKDDSGRRIALGLWFLAVTNRNSGSYNSGRDNNFHNNHI
jgi:hypothetical protein